MQLSSCWAANGHKKPQHGFALTLVCFAQTRPFWGSSSNNIWIHVPLPFLKEFKAQLWKNLCKHKTWPSAPFHFAVFWSCSFNRKENCNRLENSMGHKPQCYIWSNICCLLYVSRKKNIFLQEYIFKHSYSTRRKSKSWKIFYI